MIFKRFAAMFYDTCLVISMFVIATLFVLIFNNGQSIAYSNYFFKLYLIFIWYAFTIWFHLHAEQTTGMRAWNLKLYSTKSDKLTLLQLTLRFILMLLTIGLCGIGLIWMLIDKEQQTLYDRLSKTRLWSS